MQFGITLRKRAEHFEKAKSSFGWLHKQQSDIIFWQETYSSPGSIKDEKQNGEAKLRAATAFLIVEQSVFY